MSQRSRDVLALDPENGDAIEFMKAAERRRRADEPATGESEPAPSVSDKTAGERTLPSSFADGRYKVHKFLGEGGKKMVYFAQDTLLDRDVAFALIKTDGLDATSRTRISREAQAMGRPSGYAAERSLTIEYFVSNFTGAVQCPLPRVDDNA